MEAVERIMEGKQRCKGEPRHSVGGKEGLDLTQEYPAE